MVALSAVGFGVFFLASLAIGVRLLALAARTRRQPELLIGIGILGIGPTAMGSMMAAAALAGSAPGLARGLTGLAFAAREITEPTPAAPIPMPQSRKRNSLHGVTSAILMWVAFLPPAAWKRFVLESHRATAA